MELALNAFGQKSWCRPMSSMMMRYVLLFSVLLTPCGMVVSGVAATAPGSVNEQYVAAMTGHHVPCCYQSGQTTYHDGSGTHVTCAFCVPVPQTFEQVAPPTSSEIFLQDFVVRLGRNAAPEPFPPKIIPTV